MRFVSLRVLFVLICLVLAGIAEPSDGQIFVSSNDVPSIIGEYTLSGTPINPKLITGIAPPAAITIAGGNIFVANYTFGTIGEYSITGTPINTSLISGLNAPFSLQIDGSLMYVANSAQFQARQGSVGLYTTSGATVKSSFITGLSGPDSIAISDGKLYVLSLGVPGAHSGTLGVYDAVTGAVINANLISGLNSPEGLAISGQNVFIGVQLDGGIKEYDTSGALINSSFISDPDVWSIVAVGDKLFVGNTGSGPTGNVGEYTTSGQTVNASLITGLVQPYGIAVNTVPEPSCWSLFVCGIGVMLLGCRRSTRAILL